MVMTDTQMVVERVIKLMSWPSRNRVQLYAKLYGDSAKPSFRVWRWDSSYLTRSILAMEYPGEIVVDLDNPTSDTHYRRDL
ncbi:hypothetical protein LCGC14_1572470 [marine sediment metagenome]|uniref:Uncharacterized protein n=1 Tax=marine sediment metagenome TaxID=412755 RepID=A0A0F9LJQ7_9ZZZZ